MTGKIVGRRKLNLDTGEYEETPTYFLDGKEVDEPTFKAAFPDKGIGITGGMCREGWPILSDALKYHPKQRAEATEHLKKLGVPTEIDKTGRPVIRDRAHRGRLLKALKLHCNNSFYGN